ncbi:MAG: phage major capsid protein [bacterium]|nr:phage major capsid protein [bacterium]
MAGQFTWTSDVSGVLKNNDISNKVFRAAVADSKCQQFCTVIDGFGRHAGESVTMPRAANLDEPTSATLSETQRIPEDTFALSSKAVTVNEYGRAVSFSAKSEVLTKPDLPAEIEDALRRRMATSIDIAAIAGFQSAKVKAVPDGEASLDWTTNGTAGSAATVNLNFYHVEQIRDYMMATLHVPAFKGDEYFSLASTKALRGLKQDPKFEVWNQYSTPENKANGEVGKIEGIRFIEVNNTSVLSGSKGTGSVLGEAVFFGADAVAMAVVDPVHLVYETNYGNDFGRQHAIAWYGILGFDIIWDTGNAGQARIVHVTST